MRLLLIRHGQTSSNVLGLLDTAAPGAALTVLGAEQASAIPGALEGHPVDLIAVSTLIRTQLTAGPLAAARGLTPLIRGGIREISAGRSEMSGDLTAVQAYLSVMGRWMDGNLDEVVPGGEGGHAVLGRFDAVVAEIADTGVTSGVLFSHGAVIRVWTALRCRNLSADFGRANRLGNTGIAVLEGDPESGWIAAEWMGTAIGGPRLDAPAADGPSAGGRAY